MTSTLASVLDGSRGPGVLSWPDPEPWATVQAAARDAGWTAVVIHAGTKPELLTAVASALAFPAWFGHNLDALADCLADLPSPTLLVWNEWESLARDEPDDFAGFLSVFTDRSASAPPFVVLLPHP